MVTLTIETHVHPGNVGQRGAFASARPSGKKEALLTPAMLIDANIYLDLYRTVSGRKLLTFLEGQHAHVFISQQIVDEVTRNKLDVAKTYFSGQLATVASTIVPDHLFGISDEETTKIRKTLEKAKRASKELRELASKALIQISRSEDDVSNRLASLFRMAITPTPDQMQRARARKETGNPPGKPSDPLGDEITWEQFLTYCDQHNSDRVWIVTRDGDYCAECDKGSFVLNSMLYHELRQVRVKEIRCFGDLLAASEDFAQNAGVEELVPLTTDELKEIRKEIDALPPLWTYKTDPNLANVRLTAETFSVGSPVFGEAHLSLVPRKRD